jgi:hypothetical protein
MVGGVKSVEEGRFNGASFLALVPGLGLLVPDCGNRDDCFQVFRSECVFVFKFPVSFHVFLTNLPHVIEFAPHHNCLQVQLSPESESPLAMVASRQRL